VVIADVFARLRSFSFSRLLSGPAFGPSAASRAERLRRLRAASPRGAPALFALALASALGTAAVGCSREPSSDVVAEPTPSVPTDVVFYTHVLYGGDDAYLVDGQWFRPASTGWVVFTKEPLELRLIRQSTEPARATTWWPPL